MTLEQKDKSKKILDIIYRIFVVSGVGGLIFVAGAKNKDIETKTFSSSEMKVATEYHINHMPNDVDTYRAWKRIDSLTKQWKIDKKEEERFRNKQEELNERNATTIYQLKKSQEEQTKLTKEILNKIN